jgi:purine-binding chemotaxis protein CheW
MTPILMQPAVPINSARCGDTTAQGLPKHLFFEVAAERFAVDVHRVRDISELPEVNPLPHAPGSVAGVVSSRGRVITALDLRRRFGFEECAAAVRPCLVVVAAEGPQGGYEMGLIVDAVLEVATVGAERIEPGGLSLSGDCDSALVGLFKYQGGVTYLLDVDRLAAGTALPGAPGARAVKP